jgi:hypothetical protein
VSNGTVTNIIKEATTHHPELLLQREVAVLFRKEDMQLSEVADTIRIHRILRDLEFIAEINRISCLLHNLKINLEQLPSYIQQKIKGIDDIEPKETLVPWRI